MELIFLRHIIVDMFLGIVYMPTVTLCFLWMD